MRIDVTRTPLAVAAADADALHRHDNAWRAALAAAPLAIGSVVFALVAALCVIAPSGWRSAWTSAAFALLAAAAVAPWAGRRPHGTARSRRRWRRAYGVLFDATMAVLCVAPWMPASSPLPDAGLLLVLLVAPAAIGGAVAFASLRIGLGFAVAMPLSAALAAACLDRGARQELPAGCGAGLVLAGVAFAAGMVARRAWRHAVADLQRRAAHVAAVEAERDAASRADQDKSRFLATASHDLRQPIQALGLFATTLEKRLRDGPEHAIVRNIARTVDGLDRSFNAMLDISRLDAGAVEPNIQRFPLRDVFRRLDMYFSGAAEQAGLGLRFRPGGKSVTSDPQLLERIVGNLIQNAIKYSERGGIVVVARNTATHVNIEVWDTGVGIEESELPHIFDEFYQVGRRQRAHVQGLGMGLAIVKRLAILLGHTLTVSSRPGRGTVFRLGIALGGMPGIEDATAAADTLPMALPDPRTILVVDDDDAIREGLALLLGDWGYEAVCAASLQQAQRLARTLDMPPDLILSDLHLGDGPDGIAAIDAVRRECGCEMPAILITAEGAHDELRRATDGANRVLRKPVQPRKLLEALQELIA